MGPGARGHFEVLDGLRGVAAAMVLFGHATAVILGPEHTLVPRKGLAVVFFFMLSGFVVASAYDERLRRGMPVGAFMLRRAIRLYPLILLGTGLGAAWFIATEPAIGAKGVLAIGLGAMALPAPDPGFSFSLFPINPPTWSLFLEMVAYAAFATLRLRMAGLLLVSALCFVGFALLDSAYYDALTPFVFGVFEAGAAFSAGVCLWHLHEAGRLPRVQVPSGTLAIAVMALCLCPHALGPAVDSFALVLVFPAVLVLGAAKGRGAAGPIERLLGDLSFPVYVLHWPVLKASDRFVEPRFGAAAAIVVALVGTIALAWLALRFYDEPVRRWLTDRLAPQRPAATRSAENTMDQRGSSNPRPAGLASLGPRNGFRSSRR